VNIYDMSSLELSVLLHGLNTEFKGLSFVIPFSLPQPKISLSKKGELLSL
jgi:hypothetical protein